MALLNRFQILESPIDENDGNSTAAAKALYSSCMNTGQFDEIIYNPKLSDSHSVDISCKNFSIPIWYKLI